jgi:hypothetical protein
MIWWRILPLGLCLLAASTGRAPDRPDLPRKSAARSPASRPAASAEKRPEHQPTDQEERSLNLSSEELGQLLEFTRANFPKVHEQLINTLRDDPPAFRQMLGRIGPPMMSLMRLSRDNPKEAEYLIRLQKLEMEVRELRARYRAARSDEDRNSVREEARRLLQERFEARQQRLKAEIDRYQQRLDELNRRYADQNQRRERTIKDEMSHNFEPPRPSPRPPRTRAATRPAITD